MSVVRLTHRSPYAARLMFELVADVESYPLFLPYCAAARVRSREPDGAGEIVHAELVGAYKILRETYASEVRLQPPARIEMRQTKGPFESLNGVWVFTDEGDGSRIDFEVRFDMRFGLLRRIVAARVESAAQIMLDAFAKRADALYCTVS